LIEKHFAFIRYGVVEVDTDVVDAVAVDTDVVDDSKCAIARP
jgi:hypothetical protein